MKNDFFKPHHINASPDDLAGNNGIGRYVLLPGSIGRAQKIAEHFENMTVKQHPRGHHLHLGTLTHEGKKIDVATVPSGMGCPSMEIVLHELFQLGAKRFLRVGTAGSLQPSLVKMNNIVNAQASVRDEDTTSKYIPVEMPAVASLEMLEVISAAAKKLELTNRLHVGTVHCKSSFYAREFGQGPQSAINEAYMHLLTRAGVLASEMETAALFVQSQLYNYQLSLQGTGPQYKVLCGAILGIIAVPPNGLPTPDLEAALSNDLISLGIEAIKQLYRHEAL